MGNLTSTLTISLQDDVSGKAGRAANALKQLGASGDSLKKLAAASPQTAKLVRELERLQALSGKIDLFKGASRSLDDLGMNLRKVRNELSKADAVVAKRERTLAYFERKRIEQPARWQKWKDDGLVDGVGAALAKAKRARERAARAVEPAKAAFMEQGRHVRALSQDLIAAGVPLRGLRTAEDGLKASIASVNAEIARQPALLAAAASNVQRLGQASRDLARGMSAVGASQMAAIEQGRRLADGMGAQARAARALREEQARLVQVEHQRKRATASADLVAGMGGPGRREAERIADGRRVAQGMSAPEQAARAERERVAREAAEHRAERAAQGSEARRAIAGMAGLYVSHKVNEGTRATLHTYREFDKERRFGKAVMGLTDAEQAPLVEQAIHMGATTKYNDVQVLESQRELAARGLNRDQVMGLLGPAADLGQSLALPLPQAVRQMEGALFGFQKPIGTLEEAIASARHTADLQVKAAKVSGMTPDDLTQAYKYAATPARMSGVSEEMMLAFAGISKKANMGGDEAGVAFRALVASGITPTRKAKEAYLANGMDFKNYQKNPERLALEPFVKNVAAQYGVKLDKKTQAGLEGIFSNESLIADPAAFTPAVMKLLGDNLGGNDAKSKKSIAGAANRYRDASMQGVDLNALIADLLKKIPGNLQLANAVFGPKQGARIATALGDPKLVAKIVDDLRDHAGGYAAKISAERMEGFDGAVSRFEGAIKNVETAFGRAWDDDGRGGFLTGLADKAARATQALAEMPRPVLQVGSAVAWLTGKVAGAAGTLALVGAAISLKGSAVALTAAAAKLAMSGGLPGKVPVAAAVPAGGATPAAAAAGSVLGPAVVGAAVAAGGVAATVIANEAVKNRDFADPYLSGGMLGADPAGYGLGAAIQHAPDLPEARAQAALDAQAAARAAAAREAAAAPGIRRSALPTEVGSGRLGFGLGGAVGSPLAVPAGRGAQAVAARPDPASGLVMPEFGRSPFDPAALDAARASLAALRQELAGIAAQTRAISADGNPDLLPALGNLDARKGEVERLIGEMEARIKAISAETISPRADASGLQPLDTAAEATKAKLDAVSAAVVAPKGDASGLSGIEGVLDRLIAKLSQLGSAMSAARAQAASLSVPGRPAAAPAPATGATRRALSNGYTDSIG